MKKEHFMFHKSDIVYVNTYHFCLTVEKYTVMIIFMRKRWK